MFQSGIERGKNEKRGKSENREKERIVRNRRWFLRFGFGERSHPRGAAHGLCVDLQGLLGDTDGDMLRTGRR